MTRRKHGCRRTCPRSWRRGTITQELLDDPNLMLRQHIKGQNITSFDVFTLSTDSLVSGVPGGGTANVSGLVDSNNERTFFL